MAEAIAAAAAAPVLEISNPNWCQGKINQIKSLVDSLGRIGIVNWLTNASELIKEIIDDAKKLNNYSNWSSNIPQMLSIDDSIIKYLTENEYIDLSDKDKETINKMAIELMLQQLFMLMTIICKPKVPFMPKFMELANQKLEAMNMIKKSHINNDLLNAVPYKMSGGSKKWKKLEYKGYKNLYLMSKN